jgi:two-component system cell cycle response regulator
MWFNYLTVQKGQAFMSRKKKILIVDQELTYRELLKVVLQDNYTVIDTGDSHEGLVLAELNLPALIIIDVDMPDRKGIELCEALKENLETEDIPVLLTTSLTNKEGIILGLKVGASDYITKPLCLSTVISKIESHLRTQDDYADLEHKDLLMLLQLSEAISVTRSPTAILRLIVNKISKSLGVERCSVISFTDEKKLVVKAGSDLEKNREIVLDINRYPEIRKSIETRQSVIINDIKNDPLLASVRAHITKFEYNSVVVIPLIKKESMIGTFFIRSASTKKGGISERIYKLCQLVANIAANALENAILFESVKASQEYFEEKSIQDELTKIYNRRHFYYCLKEEFSRAERYAVPLSLIFFDIDDFKRINDTYSHTQGDQVLIQIGDLLRTAARENDIPARFGGDEFAMILPNTTAKGALKLAARLCKLIKNSYFESLEGESISASIGISTFINKNIESYDELLNLADKAMYQSKVHGKGQVSQA